MSARFSVGDMQEVGRRANLDHAREVSLGVVGHNLIVKKEGGGMLERDN